MGLGQCVGGPAWPVAGHLLSPSYAPCLVQVCWVTAISTYCTKSNGLPLRRRPHQQAHSLCHLSLPHFPLPVHTSSATPSVYRQHSSVPWRCMRLFLPLPVGTLVPLFPSQQIHPKKKQKKKAHFCAVGLLKAIDLLVLAALKPKIGQNIGFQAPISLRSAWAPSRTYRGRCRVVHS